MDPLLADAARAVTLDEPYRALWEPLFDPLLPAVESHDPAGFLAAVEAQSRLLGRAGGLGLRDVFDGLQNGIEAMRGAVLSKEHTAHAEDLAGRLLRLEGESMVRAGVGYAEGLEERAGSLALQIERLSPVDPLTGAMKPEHLESQLVLEISRCQRMDLSLGVAALVVDGLTDLTKRDGRDAADRELSRVGSVLGESLRRYDSIGRLQDNEFIAVLPDVSRSGLASAVERLRRHLEDGEGRPDLARFLFALLHLDVVDVAPPDMLDQLRRAAKKVRGGEGSLVWL
ncbi:MAG TPA: diguanylate cyclase [Thermoleophilia bacterium]|nr:diguanylate cyclase [Thermoleophilia bacterium]